MQKMQDNLSLMFVRDMNVVYFVSQLPTNNGFFCIARGRMNSDTLVTMRFLTTMYYYLSSGSSFGVAKRV